MCPRAKERCALRAARGPGWSLWVAAAMAALLALPTPAKAFEPDPWFGRDKALHFSLSSAIAMGGYGAGAFMMENRWFPLALGGGLSLGAGAGKELIDRYAGGDPSWRDFTWDAAGTAVGLGIAYLVDRLFFPKRLSAPASEKESAPVAATDLHVAELLALMRDGAPYAPFSSLRLDFGSALAPPSR